MKIESGKYYKTRVGQKAYVGYKREDKPNYSFIFIGHLVDSGLARSWAIDGAYLFSPADDDLVEIWEDKLSKAIEELTIHCNDFPSPRIQKILEDLKS